MNKYQIKIILLTTMIFFNINALQAETGIDDVWTALKPDDLTIVQNGRAIYEAQCAVCHGVELRGQPDWDTPDVSGRLPAPPHDKTGHTWHHSDDLLFEIVKYGPAKAAEKPGYQSGMPAYEKMLNDSHRLAGKLYIFTGPQKSYNDLSAHHRYLCNPLSGFRCDPSGHGEIQFVQESYPLLIRLPLSLSNK